MKELSTKALVATGQRYYLPVYKPRQLILDRGQGSRLWDIEGREYIDLSAGIAVCGLGHCDPELVAALTEQAGKLWHTSNVFYSEPPVRLAEELAQASRFAAGAGRYCGVLLCGAHCSPLSRGVSLSTQPI